MNHFYYLVDNLHRVQDMYTRDRSTPRLDSYYLGSDSLTGAAGSQIDGVTTIAFRKKVQGGNSFNFILLIKDNFLFDERRAEIFWFNHIV